MTAFGKNGAEQRVLSSERTRSLPYRSVVQNDVPLQQPMHSDRGGLKLNVIRKATGYYNRYGFRELWKKSWKELADRTQARVRSVGLFSVAAVDQAPPTASELIRKAEISLGPIGVYSSPRKYRYLNLVTDSINTGSLYGGVGTAIALGALLARTKEFRLRIVTRTERAVPANVRMILDAAEVEYSNNIEFLFLDENNSHDEHIDVHPDDLFLTTSWWTTAAVLTITSPDRVVYLLQEDERAFYPSGDDQMRCIRVLENNRLQFVVNSSLLFDHFAEQGFVGIVDNGIHFEPAFPFSLFFQDSSNRPAKKRLMFYARPNHARNLFRLGLESLNRAVVDGVVDTDQWEICLIGPDVPRLRFDNGYLPMIVHSLPWNEYAAFIRSIDVGLSLMASPHPSYPPLDLAASGAVVVTNTFGVKRTLDRYSANILVEPPTVEGLVLGLGKAIAMSERIDEVRENYLSSRFVRSWEDAFASVLPRI